MSIERLHIAQIAASLRLFVGSSKDERNVQKTLLNK